MTSLLLPRLHIVADSFVLERDVFARNLEQLLAAGGPRIALHLRGHSLTGAELWRHAEECGELARHYGTLLVINDRLDIALGCGAGSVQLGSRSFPVDQARARLGPNRSIGVSVHSIREAEEAVEFGADFLLAGTLYESASHPGRPGSGVDWLEPLVALGRPVIGIGGITDTRVAEVLATGAHGVAVVRAIWGADRPVVAMGSLLARMEDGR